MNLAEYEHITTILQHVPYRYLYRSRGPIVQGNGMLYHPIGSYLTKLDKLTYRITQQVRYRYLYQARGPTVQAYISSTSLHITAYSTTCALQMFLLCHRLHIKYKLTHHTHLHNRALGISLSYQRAKNATLHIK